VQKLKENSQHIASFASPIVSGDASKATGIVGYIWGYPVYLSDKITGTTAVSTKFMIFGNLKFLYLGDRKQMTVDISQDATIGSANMFESNMSAVRITERIGLTVALASAFALLKTAAS
jgi:HK97 family phage major capsid protein